MVNKEAPQNRTRTAAPPLFRTAGGIQKRMTDAYYSRCQRGFHMSGAAPFGFKLDRVLVYPDNRIEIAYKIKDIFD